MKKRITALLLCLVMVFSLIPTTVWAASNSTVVLHPSVNSTVTGVKVKVGDKIDGHAITSISGYDITVDLGKYNVNNDTFRLPYAKDIWEGVDNNKVDYISWAGSGSNRRNEGANALLANGKNTAYYYFKGAPVLLTFTLNYDANGGTGAPASQTYKATSEYEKSHTFTISSQVPTRDGYTFLGWDTNKNATTASKQPSNTIVVTGTTTLYAVWEQKQHEHKDNDDDGFCDKDNTCMHPKDADGKCTIPSCTHPDSCCPKPSSQPDPNPPFNPGKPSFKEDLAGKIKVKCIVDPANHTPAECMYSLGDGQYTDNGMNNATDVPTYSITLNNASFIEKFDTATDYQHTDKTGGNVVITWRWDAENENWKLISGTPTIKCECVKEIEPPTDGPTDADVKAALGNVTVTVKCINPGTKHTSCAYGVLGGNDGYQLTKNEDGTYNVVLNAAPFVAAYSKSGQGRGFPHDLYSAKTLTWVLTYEEGKWVANPETPGVDDTILVTHIPKATYDVLKGMQGVIKTRCVNNTTAYTEYGVIAGVVGESAASAQVVKNADGAYILTVSTKNFADAASKHNDRFHDLRTGETANFVLSLSKNDADEYFWTATPVTPDVDNVCEVAHRVKVTFDQNYTNAPAATEAMYKYDTAEVMEGAFPTDPVRDGYVFQGWNTNADGTGAPFSKENAVTEDVIVYAQWQEKTYIIASDLRINGGDANLADGKTVQSGKTFDGGIALYVGLSVLSVTGSAWVITKKKRG